MAYLESIRYARRVAFRTAVSGQRVPMELTPLGRAYLATIAPAQRAALVAVFRLHRHRPWEALHASIRQVLGEGWCAAS